MIQNRSASPGTMVPCLVYEDVARAIDWLCGAFGFTERLRTPPEPDGTIHHAQLALGGGSVILTGRRGGPQDHAPDVLVRVEDLDAHCARARQFGARIVMEPGSKEFGERQYGAEDLAGRRWTFTESAADVAPEQWGARVGQLQPPPAPRILPRICYLEIPAADVRQSAAFYEKIFGWNIRRRESNRPSFDDASSVSGAWVAGRPPAREPGLLPYVWVKDIHATLAAAVAQGGQAVDPVRPDEPGGNCLIATFRDPAGNLIGLYHEPL